MNIIQKIRRLVFGSEEIQQKEINEIPEDYIYPTNPPTETPKPKRKYNKKKKSTGESK